MTKIFFFCEVELSHKPYLIRCGSLTINNYGLKNENKLSQILIGINIVNWLYKVHKNM